MATGWEFCMYCGERPDSGGTIHHQANCALRKIGQDVPEMGGVEHGPAIDREKQFDPSFLKPGNPIEHRIRAICREEISQHVEMAKSLAAFSEQLKPKECEQCKKLQTMLDMARSALEKVVGMDPQAAAQRAQMNMPAEHDIARMTLAEIKRMENADG